MTKRLLDVLGACVLLVLLAPVLLAVALAILLADGRPVLFAQERLGRGGRPFRMLKFRSMVRDASTRGPYFTAAGDARISRIGHVLRRTSLDELPQLWNVLRGDMSLVGPRPDVPAQRPLYSEADWAARCSVRPGITGLAQALLRSAATEEERLRLDLRYAREHSLWLDLRILAWTLRRLGGAGSH